MTLDRSLAQSRGVTISSRGSFLPLSYSLSISNCMEALIWHTVGRTRPLERQVLHVLGVPALPADSSAFVLVAAAATTNVTVSFIYAGAKGLCGSSNGSGHQLPPFLNCQICSCLRVCCTRKCSCCNSIVCLLAGQQHCFALRYHM